MTLTLTLTPGMTLRIEDATASSLAEQLAAAGFGRSTVPADLTQSFDDDHVIWSRHTGGSGHYALPEWSTRDADRAEAYYAAVHGKARTFLDLLIDRPGERLSTDDLRRFAPGVFGNDHAIAGSVKGLSVAQRACDRRYPFYWWRERPTRYAMKPTVAALFAAARDRVG